MPHLFKIIIFEGRNARMSSEKIAETRDRTRDLQIFSLTLSQLSYCGAMLYLAASSMS